MPEYVDGFVLPLPQKNLEAYKKIARVAAKVWREHGALDYRECIGDDLNVKMGVSFPKGMQVKRGETVVFAWITYKSRAQRDKVNAKVMNDPRIKAALPEKTMPFDHTRMMWGGFTTIVSA